MQQEVVIMANNTIPSNLKCKGQIVLEHLRKYIGLYMTAMILSFMFGYGVSEEHPNMGMVAYICYCIMEGSTYSIGDPSSGEGCTIL